MEIEKAPSLSLKDLLIVTFKRKTQILVFFGSTVFIAAIASFIVPPTYEARAQILLKIGREDIHVPILPTGTVSTSPKGRSSLEQINAEIQILKSRFIAEKVIESLGPAVIYKDLNSVGHKLLDRALTRFQESLTVQGIGESNVINISFKHTSPRLAATVVSTLIQSYLDRHLEVHKRPQPETFFNMQVGTLGKSAKLAEEKLHAFKNKHGVTSLEEEKTLLLQHVADLRSVLNQTLSEETGIENRILQLRDLATTPETFPIDDRLMSDLQARLVELKLQENELLTKYTDQSRLVKRAREEIMIVRRRLTEQKSEIILQEIFRNEAELRALKAKEETKRAHLADYRKRQEKLNRIEMQLNRLRGDVQTQRETYRLYLTKLEEARISDAMDKEKIANVRIIEPAHVPINPVGPNKRLNIAVAIFLGGFGGLGVAIFSEHLTDSLEKDEDVENLLHLPVLASIPQLDR